MQGAEERRVSVWNNTPQGGAIEGNTADDALMVDQGQTLNLVEALMSKHEAMLSTWTGIWKTSSGK